MLFDFKLDESYTPNRLIVRAGSGVHDLKVGAAACCPLPLPAACYLSQVFVEWHPWGCVQQALYVQAAACTTSRWARPARTC